MEKKDEIAEKALKLFLERGYDNTPMSLVAKEVGLSKGGFFHHFRTKETLLYDVIIHSLKKDFVPLLEKAGKIGDPKQRIIYFIDNLTKLMAKNNEAKVVVHDSHRLAPAHYNKIRKIWRQTFELLRDAFSELKASGGGKGLNSSFVAFSIIGMCNWTFYWFDYSGKDSAQELSDTFIEILLRGFTESNGSDGAR